MNPELFVGLACLFLSVAVVTGLLMTALVRRFEKMKAELFGDENASGDDVHYFVRSGIGERQMMLLFGITGAVLSVGLGFPLILALIVGVAAGGITLFLIRRAKTATRKKLDEQFVNALGLLTNALRAGQTLPQAIDSCTRSIERPLSTEFTIMSRQLRVGMDLENALGDFASRVTTDDVYLATKAMVFSSRTGADLPKAFAQIAETIRSRKSVQGKIDALTAQGKAQGVVVGIMPAVLMGIMYLMNPDYVMLFFTTFIGNLALVCMVIMQTAAIFVIRKIIRIDI